MHLINDTSTSTYQIAVTRIWQKLQLYSQSGCTRLGMKSIWQSALQLSQQFRSTAVNLSTNYHLRHWNLLFSHTQSSSLHHEISTTSYQVHYGRLTLPECAVNYAMQSFISTTADVTRLHKTIYLIQFPITIIYFSTFSTFAIECCSLKYANGIPHICLNVLMCTICDLFWLHNACH